MENYTITSPKKFIRLVASGSPITKTAKLATPILTLSCDTFFIYAAINDYPHGTRYSVSIRYEEIVSATEYTEDIKKAGAAIAEIAAQAKIKKVTIATVIIGTEEKLLLGEAVKKGLKIVNNR